MARRRTPTPILKLRGADKKHPDRMRARENEPKPTGDLGPCPKRYDPEVREAWRYIVKCVPAGVLTEMDRVIVAQAAALLATFWADPLGFPNPLHARLESILGRLGMTPVDRSKVVVPKKDDSAGNRFARLLREA